MLYLRPESTTFPAGLQSAGWRTGASSRVLVYDCAPAAEQSTTPAVGPPAIQWALYQRQLLVQHTWRVRGGCRGRKIEVAPTAAGAEHQLVHVVVLPDEVDVLLLVEWGGVAV